MKTDDRKKVDILCCLCLMFSIIAFCMSFASFYELCKNSFLPVREQYGIEEQKDDYEGNIKGVEPFVVEIAPLPKLKSIGIFTLTAYCPCEKCCGKWGENRPKDEDGIPIVYGSTGIELKEGVSVAVDPNVIPYGSEIVIYGHTYTAQDCGGAIKDNRIDVYFSDHNRALEFAVQEAEVFVFE